MRVVTKLWIGLLVLAVLSPLGLFIPAHFGAKTAWGEWSREEIKALAGYVPQGMQRLAGLWKPLAPDYSVSGAQDNFLGQGLSYIFSALAGIALCAGIIFLLGKFLSKR